MQTHCPHCETHFRITKSQIDIADGYVRCGICEEVFNIHEVSNNTSIENEQTTLLNEADGISDDTPNIINGPNQDAEDLIYEEENKTPYQAASDSQLAEPDTVEHSDTFHKKPDDFFNEDANESLQHVVPEDLRSYKAPSILTTSLWSIGILLLISSFTLEYIWFNRDDFSQFPSIQTKIEQLCEKFQCNKQLQRDPDKIELLSRSVYTHPNEKDALMINLVIKNTAVFAQPYPVMEVEFSDIRGNSIAARRFLPFEYLATRYQHNETKKPHILKPNTDASVTLEIKDPGNDAMTYEFNFL